MRKASIGLGDAYTTGSLVDYNYFLKHLKIHVCNLSQRQQLDADPRALQQIEVNFMLDTNSQILTVLEKSKETILEFYKGTAKVL